MRLVLVVMFAMMIADEGWAEELGPGLPPGPGHDVTAQTCLICHGADTITQRHLSVADWKELVDVMVNFGAKADDKQKAEIVDYLSRTFPPVVVAPSKNDAAPLAQ
jgi:hypothetical protein